MLAYMNKCSEGHAIHYSRKCVNIYSHLVPSNFMFMQVSDLTSALIDGIKKTGIKTVRCHEPVGKKVSDFLSGDELQVI